MINLIRLELIQWSEFVKITKFGKEIGVSRSAISSFLKYGTKSLSDEKIVELHEAVKTWIAQNFV